MVSMRDASIENVGAHPSARIRSVASRIFGESPTHPRTPPAYSIRGVTPSSRQMIRTLSFTSIQSSWPRLKIVDSRSRATACRWRGASRSRSRGRAGSSSAACRCRAPRGTSDRAAASPEVDDVTVRVAGAKHRHEAEDPRPEAEAERVRGEQPLGRDLRRRVERGLDGDRRVLGRRASSRARRRPSRWTRSAMHATPRSASPRGRSASRGRSGRRTCAATRGCP